MITKTESQAFLQVNLIRLMDEAGLGTKALAMASKTDQNAISRIRKHGKVPEADKLLRIAKVLGVTVEELFRKTAAGKRKLENAD